MCYLPGSMQWMRCYLFACQLPSKELSALCPLYMIWEGAFVMQFVYHMWLLAIYVKVHKNKSNVRNIVNTILLSILQYHQNLFALNQIILEYCCQICGLTLIPIPI